MIRRPPRSTRTDTLFPYTTLFRSPLIRYSTVIALASGACKNHCVRNAPIPIIGLMAMPAAIAAPLTRSEEHTSELQSLMRISYAVFCLKKKKHRHKSQSQQTQQPDRSLSNTPPQPYHSNHLH